MSRTVPFLLILLFSPLFAFALSQGFAPGALWLSNTEASAGQTLKVYSVLYNSSGTNFEGDLDFEADDESIQTVHFKLAAGETKIMSADWSAVVGSHTFTARLKNIPDGSLAGPSVTDAVHITVATGTPSLVNNYINTANNFLASTSPGLASFASNVASTTESWRKAGAEWLSNALYTDQSTSSALIASKTPTQEGQVLGTTTYRAPMTTSDGIWASLKRYILAGLLFIFNIQILFYLSICVVLYVLYKILQAMFRSRRRGAE